MSTPEKATIERAMSSSLRYIVSHQSEDGSWIDWKLPVGESDAWTTAYIGYKLRLLPHYLQNEAQSSIDNACKWLLKHEYADGGWGYNENVGI